MEDAKPGILPFLYPQSLPWEEVERRLGRPLTGDPTRGERGVVAALGRTRIDAVRQSLERDASLGADFSALIRAHLTEMERHWHTSRAWRIQVSGPVWDEYARESRASQRTIGECLSAAVQRDYERRMAASDPLADLERALRVIQSTGLAVLQRLETFENRTMASDEVTRRLQRIEDAVTRGPRSTGK
jgi:hypothetical protein